jgi:hypothetical protein
MTCTMKIFLNFIHKKLLYVLKKQNWKTSPYIVAYSIDYVHTMNELLVQYLSEHH